jgi:hypothetical protein
VLSWLIVFATDSGMVAVCTPVMVLPIVNAAKFVLVVSVVSVSSSAANTTSAPAKVEEKAAAKKVVEEVKVEEEDVDMGGLFD